MDREAIEKRILEILEKQMGPFQDGYAKPENTWFELGMDELDQVEFLMNLEDEWDMEIEDSDWDRCKTLRGATVIPWPTVHREILAGLPASEAP